MKDVDTCHYDMTRRELWPLIRRMLTACLPGTWSTEPSPADGLGGEQVVFLKDENGEDAGRVGLQRAYREAERGYFARATTPYDPDAGWGWVLKIDGKDVAKLTRRVPNFEWQEVCDLIVKGHAANLLAASNSKLALERRYRLEALIKKNASGLKAAVCTLRMSSSSSLEVSGPEAALASVVRFLAERVAP